jgi:hypothetical protein
MTPQMRRFPRQAYAQRAASLAFDLEDWRTAYIQVAHAIQDESMDDHFPQRIHARALVLAELAVALRDVATRLYGIR